MGQCSANWTSRRALRDTTMASLATLLSRTAGINQSLLIQWQRESGDGAPGRWPLGAATGARRESFQNVAIPVFVVTVAVKFSRQINKDSPIQSNARVLKKCHGREERPN